MQRKAVIICGPTASGKTSSAINIAVQINGEIIGADSVQIYRFLDIGSAKPTKEERLLVPHHMIDIVNPDVYYSAGDYSIQSRKIFEEIEQRNHFPIICGGTGMYIDSLVKGLFEGPRADQGIRNDLKLQEESDKGCLHRRLLEVDPHSASRISENDIFRLTRALEVFILTNKTLSEHHKEHQASEPFCTTLIFVIDPPRELLEARVEARVNEMLKTGFIDEVKNLLSMGYPKDLRSLQSKGYKEVIDFLDGKIHMDELSAAIILSHKKYIKQQRTWFKPRGIHVSCSEEIDLEEIKRFFQI
ncbi:tRNA (adenosine(37)-N6)-dimethylallyltransferase MiaA [Myxococcota bacterium]|nr:tRNA (adenosine(37)-N6)-dimethylallyltransferase MiaA [Myxococcota bacterium]MBU1379551.1 tRNA (adenosine(37)-N6)-dimethylallyltransferase MiaA [Myxococcota bacterium]MBU1495269.1 tRNA (adenosine(37)-N6)-dimethylallyltransferase MiaA [Myxococcota bacterium]